MLLNGSELVAWTAGMKTWSLPIDKILQKRTKISKVNIQNNKRFCDMKKSKSRDKQDYPYKDGIDYFAIQNDPNLYSHFSSRRLLRSIYYI